MSWWLDITDLDEDQKNVIDLPPTGDYLFLGPPGSGKTNLLLIRAEYLIRTKYPNLFVLMFNEPLHDFVVRGGVLYDVPAAKIRKMLSWELVLLRENGVLLKDLPEDDLDAKRKALAKKVLELLDTNPKLENHLECLLVDEVQDCFPEEVEVFFRCAKHVCFAGDNRQRIFSSHSVIPAIQERVKTIELKTHYRIGHEICRAADVVGEAAGFSSILDTCNYNDAESKVQFSCCSTDEEQINKIVEALTVQLTAYPDELLAVVGPRKRDRDFLREQLEASALAPLILPHRSSGSDDPNQRIYVAHLLEIKGLEFRTIHLALMQHIHRLRENQKRIAYTAITRAKTTVSVYFTGKIPGYLEQAQVAVEPPKPRPPLEDLFPKKKKGRK
ncbi:MAG: AAA family ATPase [Deltaproteobacteria bacterium]|nr:AAA family ATPase [Deltaproteobacteria bacterium]